SPAFIWFDRNRPAIQGRAGPVPPAVDHQPFAVRRERRLVVRRTRQRERPQVKAEFGIGRADKGLGWVAKNEVNKATVRRNLKSVCLTAKIGKGRCDGPNRLAVGVHEAEARREGGDKDSPVRQRVDAGGGAGSAIGQAPFAAEAAAIPGEEEKLILSVDDPAGRVQR